MVNRFPLWKNLLLIIVFILSLIYALPSLYGENPSLQISTEHDGPLPGDTKTRVEQMLKSANLPYLSAQVEQDSLLVRFADADTQLSARDKLKAALGKSYNVALNLVSGAPKWLDKLNAEPMPFGLDLSGGIHMLLQVDLASVIKAQKEGEAKDISAALRKARIRYQGLSSNKNGEINIRFRNKDNLTAAKKLISREFSHLKVTEKNIPGQTVLHVEFPLTALNNARTEIIDQTMSTLRNRVNGLGVSEAVVQRAGLDRVSVDLPGVQDAAQANAILGSTATLKFVLEDNAHDVSDALAGRVPGGSRVYEADGRPVLLKTRVILSGNSITSASSSFSQDGSPSVNIRLGGGGESLFSHTTADNIGRRMAVIYVETKPEHKQVDGETVTTYRTVERVISLATIRGALTNSFEISGLENTKRANELALLLRSGAMPANISIIEETTIGPQLGAANIEKGLLSLEIGLGIIALFMLLYYRIFGLIANLALVFNLVMIVAIMSALGATMSLAGIAGIVLNVGMAIDANVLIFERIREELRHGLSPQGAIHAGYERAFSTIVDANVTTLIVAVILYGLGSGPIKGFATTVSIGILTSMYTQITGTRAIINWLYGSRPIKRLSIGI